MDTIILHMKRKPVEQLLIDKLSTPKRQVLSQGRRDGLMKSVKENNALALVLEVSETDASDITRCLQLFRQISRASPGCKRIIMCSEKNEQDVNQAVAALRSGEIDDFFFYDATLEYLLTKLKSI